MRTNVGMEMLRSLIFHGVDVCARDQYGVTCLHHAANCGTEAILLLVAAGADVDAADNGGNTPLLFALSHAFDSDTVVRALFALILLGADVHATDHRGRSVCHAAAARGSAWPLRNILLWVILLGADFDAPDDSGATPRQLVANALPTDNELKMARAQLTRFIIDRAFDVCVGLQSLRISALQMCEILQFACGPAAVAVPFHVFWRIATTVKHFHSKNERN